MKRKDISASSKVLLAGMAMESKCTGRLLMSDGALAKTCGIARSQVIECKRRLEKTGLITKDGDAIKQVQPYKILDQRLSQRNSGQPGEIVVAASKRELATCLRCRKKCGSLSKAGWCRACNADAKLDRKVRVAIDTALKSRDFPVADDPQPAEKTA
jgi:hypothetical protein